MGIENHDISPLMNNNNSSIQIDEDEKNILSDDQLFSSTVNPDANAPTAPATPTGIATNDSNTLEEQFLASNEELREIQDNAPTMVIEKKSPIGTPQKDFTNAINEDNSEKAKKKQNSLETTT